MTEKCEKGRVVEICTWIVFGTIAAVLLALGMSKVSRTINTAFIKRENGTDRHRKVRRAGKTYRFSKAWRYHEAVTYLSLYCYNFCWPVRTLTVIDAQGGHLQNKARRWRPNCTDHVWSMSERSSRPAVKRS